MTLLGYSCWLYPAWNEPPLAVNTTCFILREGNQSHSKIDAQSEHTIGFRISTGRESSRRSTLDTPVKVAAGRVTKVVADAMRVEFEAASATPAASKGVSCITRPGSQLPHKTCITAADHQLDHYHTYALHCNVLYCN